MRNYIYFVLALIIFILDRVTKLIALHFLQIPIFVNRFLSFELVFNRGISWGFFYSTIHGWFLVVSMVIAAITALLCLHAYRAYQKGKSIVGYVCIITGSVCNLIDRCIYGGVIDFILLSYNSFSWPVFNIADAIIVCGVGLLVFLDEI